MVGNLFDRSMKCSGIRHNSYLEYDYINNFYHIKNIYDYSYREDFNLYYDSYLKHHICSFGKCSKYIHYRSLFIRSKNEI